MILFEDLSKELPYKAFRSAYDRAIDKNQGSIEAICISSFSKTLNEVNSRFVNLKYIINDKFVFFSNYNSPKSNEFDSHNQISALIYWNSINTQIRIKGKINRTQMDFNNTYFSKRDKYKNALAISSDQSKVTNSYDDVRERYLKVLDSNQLLECPDYWGGFSITPYYFEFWEGHKNRLNRRKVYEKHESSWKKYLLQP